MSSGRTASLGVPKLKLDEDSRVLVEVNLDRITLYFTCAVCKGLFRDPHTISECVHTFCKSCIVQKMSQYQECPVCKTKSALDTVRPDHTMQSLLQKLFPEAEKEDEEREKRWYEENNIPMPEKQQNVVSQSTTVSGKPSKSSKPQENKRQRPDQSGQATTTTTTNGAAKPNAVSRIRMMVKSESDQYNIPEPNLELASTTKVEKMRAYIAKRLGISPETITLSCEGQVLPLEHSAEFVQRTFWKDPTTSMVWWYKVAAPS